MKTEMQIVVLPPDGSADSDEGSHEEDREDELYGVGHGESGNHSSSGAHQ